MKVESEMLFLIGLASGAAVWRHRRIAGLFLPSGAAVGNQWLRNLVLFPLSGAAVGNRW